GWPKANATSASLITSRTCARPWRRSGSTRAGPPELASAGVAAVPVLPPHRRQDEQESEQAQQEEPAALLGRDAAQRQQPLGQGQQQETSREGQEQALAG